MSDPITVQSQSAPQVYNDSSTSDLTIRYSDQTVHAHRNVLCKGSTHFRNMLDGGFATKVYLYDDHAPAVTVMLRHLYGHDYTDPSSAEWTDPDDLTPHIQVYIVADKYLCKSLKTVVLKQIQIILQKHSTAIHPETRISPPAFDCTPVPGHRDLRRPAFTILDLDYRHGLRPVPPFTQDLADAIKLIFDVTPPTDDVLRPWIVRLCANSMHYWRRGRSIDIDFTTWLSSIPALGTAITLHVDDNLGIKKVDIWTCPACNRMHTWQDLFQCCESDGCSHCGLRCDSDDIWPEGMQIFKMKSRFREMLDESEHDFHLLVEKNEFGGYELSL